MRKITYIYILSQRYSGSTLLSFLLATHPAIATIGERRKFYNKTIRPDQQSGQQCSCGQSFQQCEYWTAIRDAVSNRLTPEQRNNNFTEFELFNQRILNKIADKLPQWGWFPNKRKQQYQANLILVEEILKKAQKSVFLDSSKTYKQLRHLSQIDDFDFKVIWLSRDPRAQVSSALK
ncbi:MAG: sulfotransferase, partial [Bacteroidota bacterium]